VSKGAAKNETVMKALARVPSGLFILTAGRGEGAVGTLVSFVQQVSIEPPCLAVALRPERGAAAVLAKEKFFVINVLHAGDKTLLRAFAKESLSGREVFETVESKTVERGGAVLSAACAYLECELEKVLNFAGDHQLFVGRVVGGALLGEAAAKPIVHLRQDGSRY
jgi:flavin reductase (DIM6/NTAB) family NADH-FMN oxidoreductase RutF